MRASAPHPCCLKDHGLWQWGSIWKETIIETPTTKISEWLDRVGPGWHPILVQLHTDVTGLDPEYSVLQVKEKFGGLRAYLNYQNPEVAALVKAAEILSAQTCENCGASGWIRNRKNSRWLQCLCDLCVLLEPEPES